MTRLRTILVLAGVLLAASAIAGVAEPRLGRAAAAATAKTITVTGSGSVTTVPDQAGFDFTVDTRAATAKSALAQNAAAAAAVAAAIKNAGIDAADIQTSQVSLSPADEPGRYRRHRLRGVDHGLRHEHDCESRLARRCGGRSRGRRRLGAEPVALGSGRAIPRRPEARGRRRPREGTDARRRRRARTRRRPDDRRRRRADPDRLRAEVRPARQALRSSRARRRSTRPSPSPTRRASRPARRAGSAATTRSTSRDRAFPPGRGATRGAARRRR